LAEIETDRVCCFRRALTEKRIPENVWKNQKTPNVGNV
jgi:hypothetical protein